MILTVEGRTFPVDIFYLQRFDDPCLFNDGRQQTWPVLWNEKQLHLLPAPRAVCQAGERGMFRVSCHWQDVLEPCSVSLLNAFELLTPVGRFLGVCGHGLSGKEPRGNEITGRRPGGLQNGGFPRLPVCESSSNDLNHLLLRSLHLCKKAWLTWLGGAPLDRKGPS